jgi:hypothetical protein
MFVWEKIESINEQDFNRLFDASLPSMDGGSYKWDLFPNVVTEEQKRNHIKTLFEHFINVEDGIVFQVRQDDKVLQYNAGTLANNHLTWSIGLIGRDVNGSKSFMYAEEYHDAEAQFWSDMNIQSWEMQTAGQGTTMHDHVMKIFDKYDKVGPAEASNTSIEGIGKFDEVDLTKGQRYDLNMKMVTVDFISNPSDVYVEPSNTQIEEEMAGYFYLNSNTSTSNT